MIEIKDVVTLKVPFPDISSDLAIQAHMYICSKNGSEKNFFKCQRAKPHNLLPNRRPYKFVKEASDPSRNPFNSETIIDCDKYFLIKGVTIPLNLRGRRNICDELFRDVLLTSAHQQLVMETIDITDLTQINPRITQH